MAPPFPARPLAALAAAAAAAAALVVATVTTVATATHEADSLLNVMDVDGNGIVNAGDVHDYAFLLDSDHAPSLRAAEHVLERFYDTNGDGVLTAEELAAAWSSFLGDGRSSNTSAPEQVHLSLGGPGEMVVTWVTMSAHPVNGSMVTYNAVPGPTSSVAATVSTDTDGGWHGWIYRATLTDLAPETTYAYTVGAPTTATFVSNFTTAPKTGANGFPADRPLRLFMFGDHGVFPLGFASTKAMVQHYEAARGEYDAVVLAGDVSYAGGVIHGIPELEFVWDWYGRMIQPLASHMPWMTTVGNHESSYNYSAFLSRFKMPGPQTGGERNFWFSYDVGGIHFVSFSSEHDHSVGSPQHSWIEADLKAATTRPSPPAWIIVLVHRPFYSTDGTGFQNISGHEVYDWLSIRYDVEPLLRKYNVDMTLTGHLHCYERTLPISVNGTVVPGGGKGSTVHVVQGNAGAWIHEWWLNDRPEWSARRSLEYGYGRMNVTATELHYQSVALNGTVIDDFTLQK